MIYLDYNATSPLHPEVRGEIAPFLDEAFGNASSLHAKGREARGAVESARARILTALGDSRGRLLFTSGGTEADNLALKGIFLGRKDPKKNHLILSSVEHHAVLHTAAALAEEGIRLTILPVDRHGGVDLEALQQAVTDRTLLISVMQANNEVGTIEPIEEIGRISREHGLFFHTDAVQSFGKVPLEVQLAGVDLVSLSGHKLGGPKGVGALYLRQGIPIAPILHGGPHEQNLRAGTEAVAGIVGMGKAVEVTLREREDGTLSRIERLRNRLESGLKERVPEIQMNGHPTRRLPGTLNLSFSGCQGETLLMALDLAGICVSTGSACSSGSTEPSHVLRAMGVPPSKIEGSIRFSLGWETAEEEIEECLRLIPPIVERIRNVRPSIELRANGKGRS